MKIIDVQQGSDAWRKIRLGIPTASGFDKIITPTGKPSAQANGYLNQLLAEWVLGEPADGYQTSFMIRGTEMEGEAVRWYEFQKGVKTDVVGFCLREDGLVGCSPDRLVNGDGGLEIKCPAAHNHIKYLLGSVADEYRCQVQGNLYVTDRKWWDIVSYNPLIAPAVIRVERDEEFIGKLRAELGIFLTKLQEGKLKLRELGVVPVSELEADPDEIDEIFPEN